MKTNLRSLTRLFAIPGLITGAMLLFGSLNNQVTAQTIDIGPNQYAFQFTGNPNFGLFFNSTNSQYEFRNGAASPIFAISATNGYLKTDLNFNPGSDFLVGNNRYAFRAAINPNFGLFFSATDTEYQFLNNAANPVFTINANTGKLVSSSIIEASGGNSTEWTQAHSWGNHASAGYLSSEVDPQVGAIALNRVPRWNGSSLINGSITDAGSGISVIGTSSFSSNLTVNGGFNNSTSANGLRIGSGTTFTALDNNELQAYAGGSQGLLYLNFWGGDINLANNTMWIDREDERIGINTSTPVAKLDIQGETLETENLINSASNYSGFVDVRAVNGTSITEDGYGYGVFGTGGYMGVRGSASSGGYTGTSYGVYGTASGTAGTRIGVYGNAFGGTTNNWAMFAQGNSYVSGDLRIGNQSDVPGYRLSVDGNVICEELKVQLSGDWPDYVFADDYSIMNLNDLEEYIKTENHLPGIPAAAEVAEANGIELGEMQRLTVEKLEELTLYILELKKENDQLKERIEALEN